MQTRLRISKPVRRVPLWCLSALLLLFGLGVVAYGATPGRDANKSSAISADFPNRVARLTEIAGHVSLEPAGVDQWTAAADNTPLTIGDRLYVDQDGRAELQLERAVVRAWHYTDLSVANLNDGVTQLGLAQGSLHVRTFGLTPGAIVEVDTPNGAITIVQPGDIRIDCYTGDGGTVVAVKSGAVELSGPGLSQSVGSGQSIRLIGATPVTATTLRMAGKDPFDVWSKQRDRQMLSSQTRHYVNPEAIGSDDLDQYGTWSQSADYGPVWYPTAVSADWVPYSTGYWVWVSSWGWTWVDTYAWGFAPFHYGRWVHLDARWGWVPGLPEASPVYSPAMVAFLGGADFSVDGVALSAWFPLGPGEPFYPWYPCSPGYFTRVNLANIRDTTINRTNYYSHYHTHAWFAKIRYMNRRAGTIAVNADQFASGRAITPRTAIRPSPQQIARTQIIPHPFIQPTLRSVVPRPVSSVPVSTQRPGFIGSRGEEKRGIPTADNPMPPIHTPASGFTTEPVHNNIAPVNSQNLEQRPQSQQQKAESSSPALICRTPPPPPSPSFRQRQSALGLDPGRPLGPRQENNLLQGQPAGSSKTPEFPPQPGWAPQGGSSHPR